MRKQLLLLACCTLAVAFSEKAFASSSFQFAPPPFPILNLRSVDAERNVSFDYIGMKMSGFKFDALNVGGSRAVKYWDRGGFSLGGNAQLILGRGKTTATGTSTDLTMVGPGVGLQPNFYFDLYGEEEDGFSLPFYFGPHLSMNAMMGSISFNTIHINYSRCAAWLGGNCLVWGVAENVTDTMYITNASMMYGWQAGLQAGINLGDYLKFIPYIDFSQELGGTMGTSTSSTYSGSSSTSMSIKSMPVASQPGFDIMFRKIGLDLGGAVQNTKNADGSGSKVKTTVFHLRFQKKFRSICGI